LFRTVAVLPRASGLEGLFERDAAQVAVVFEPHLAERMARGLPARIQVVSDATEPNTGVSRQSYVAAVIDAYDREQRRSGGGFRIVPESRMRFNPTRE